MSADLLDQPTGTSFDVGMRKCRRITGFVALVIIFISNDSS